MQSAFDILGVSLDADEASIRAAYHRLVKNCHPDSFQDPEQQKAGQTELIHVNLAYRQAMKVASSRQSRSPMLPPAQAKSFARKLLDKKQYDMALRQLSRSEEKDAEWYALQGETLTGLRQYLSAHQAWRAAVRNEPDNQEYRRGALEAELTLKKQSTLSGKLYNLAKEIVAKKNQ